MRNYVMAGALLTMLLNPAVYAQDSKISDANQVDPRSLMEPAPVLTQVYVQEVTSTLGGREIIGQGVYSTSRHHGGAITSVLVREIGYGANPVATMNGTVLKNAKTEAICDVGGQYVVPCPPGYWVVGWQNQYDITNSPNGRFTFQDTSSVPPINTRSVWLNIQ